jgi:hypothetical protein
MLEEMLRVVYSHVIENFHTFQFASIGHFAKFGSRIIKLTKILLSRFDDGLSNSLFKIEIM